MTEIRNIGNTYFTSNENLLKTGVEKYSKTPELKQDSVELSTKSSEKSKKSWKLVLAGIATTVLAIFGAIKTHKFIKGKKLQQLAEEEARRAAEEARKIEEETRKAAEEAQRLKEEAEQKAQAEAEKARKLKEEAEKARKLEAERLEVERLKAEEAKHLEAEKLKAEEAERLKAEEAKRLEAERLKAEEAKRIEAEKLEAERLKAEETKHLEAEKLKAEENARIESLKAELNNVQRLRPLGLAEATNIGVNFGEDLTKLVQEGRVNPEELQRLVQKHLHTDKVEIHSMSDYHKHGPVGVNAEKKAATTRATT